MPPRGTAFIHGIVLFRRRLKTLRAPNDTITMIITTIVSDLKVIGKGITVCGMLKIVAARARGES